MKASFKVGPYLTIEVEGTNQVELFAELAKISEVFGEKKCGQCASSNITFVRRSVDGNDYYEMSCLENKCGARLSMGLSKQNKGEMFPIRKIISSGPSKGKPSRKEGEYDYKHRGWTKYRGRPVMDEEE